MPHSVAKILTCLEEGVRPTFELTLLETSQVGPFEAFLFSKDNIWPRLKLLGETVGYEERIVLLVDFVGFKVHGDRTVSARALKRQ
ncbi:MAG: hypothetical protein BGP09_14095 [Rhizobium sp. 60-20]|jgi:hypothetical protein|nr:MAG: hypothetical protein BGP09_14095 [Rhizobium sp. 60-20]RKD72644.1 hypothetical protein BJ928_102429 [Rhizobium sp. WW_1]